MSDKIDALRDWIEGCLEAIESPVLDAHQMTNQTYLEAREQSAKKVDECIEMLSPAAGDEAIDRILGYLKYGAAHISLAIADEQLQRAVISREHMREKV